MNCYIFLGGGRGLFFIYNVGDIIVFFSNFKAILTEFCIFAIVLYAPRSIENGSWYFASYCYSAYVECSC